MDNSIKTSKKDQFLSDHVIPMYKSFSKNVLRRDIDEENKKELSRQRRQAEQDAFLAERKMKKREQDKAEFIENMRQNSSKMSDASTIWDSNGDPENFQYGSKVKTKVKSNPKKTAKKTKVVKKTTKKTKVVKKTTKKTKVVKKTTKKIVKKSAKKTKVVKKTTKKIVKKSAKKTPKKIVKIKSKK